MWVLLGGILSYIALGWGLFGVWFVVGLIRAHRPYTTRQAADAHAAAAAFLTETLPLLRPWEPAALADLSNHWEGSRASGFSSIDFQQGIVKSQGDSLAAGWLAFHLSRKGAYAFLRLATSAHEVRLDFTRDGIKIRSRGHYVGYARGRARVTYDLWDSQAQPIGTYVRFGGALKVAPYGPVVVRGRLLGEVCVMRRGRDHIFGSTPRPATQNLASDLTLEEADWLLAVVGLELMHCLREFRSP